MTIDRAVFVFAGVVVLVGIALAYWVRPNWVLLPAFAGLNMVQSASTGFCPAAMVFKGLGFKPGILFK